MTLDDTSSAIFWDPGWRSETTTGEFTLIPFVHALAMIASSQRPPLCPDNRAGQYFQQTFRATNQRGITATCGFRGSGIWVYGSKRYNHGDYEVDFDGRKQTYNGLGDAQFQQVLFSATDLDPYTDHYVVGTLSLLFATAIISRAKILTFDGINIDSQKPANSGWKVRLVRYRLHGRSDRAER